MNDIIFRGYTELSFNHVETDLEHSITKFIHGIKQHNNYFNDQDYSMVIKKGLMNYLEQYYKHIIFKLNLMFIDNFAHLDIYTEVKKKDVESAFSSYIYNKENNDTKYKELISHIFYDIKYIELFTNNSDMPYVWADITVNDIRPLIDNNNLTKLATCFDDLTCYYDDLLIGRSF